MDSAPLFRKRSIAEIVEQSSCPICSGLGTDTSVSPVQHKQFSVFSAVDEGFYNGMKTVLGQEHQIEKTRTASRKEVENNTEKQEQNKVRTQEKKAQNRSNCVENCFLSSSVSYGGPDDIDGIPKILKDGENEIKEGVRKLEEASNPFHLEYTTRGNWWEGAAD